MSNKISSSIYYINIIINLLYILLVILLYIIYNNKLYKTTKNNSRNILYILIMIINLYLIRYILEIYDSKNKKDKLLNIFFDFIKYIMSYYIIFKNLNYFYENGYPIYGIRKFINPFSYFNIGQIEYNDYNSMKYPKNFLIDTYRVFISVFSMKTNLIFSVLSLIIGINKDYNNTVYTDINYYKSFWKTMTFNNGITGLLYRLSMTGIDIDVLNNYYNNNKDISFRKTIFFVFIYNLLISIINKISNNNIEFTIVLIIIYILYIIVNNYNYYNYSINILKKYNKITLSKTINKSTN